MSDYIITTRISKADNTFGNRHGAVSYLEVPEKKEIPTTEHKLTPTKWRRKLLEDLQPDSDYCKDIVFFVHGFNTDVKQMTKGHRRIKAGLKAAGYECVLISFDWASDGKAFAYLPDRKDARLSGLSLVDDGIKKLVAWQEPHCKVKVHVIAHSMGAYVVREAFDTADDNKDLVFNNWTINQLCLVSADISSKSMKRAGDKTSSIYRHAIRITNYFNPYDEVLSISHVKHGFMANRLGRIGLPKVTPDNIVDVNCGKAFQQHDRENTDEPLLEEWLTGGHGWYFDSSLFYEDLVCTFRGDIDRHVFNTREQLNDNRMLLIQDTAV